jgi:hypothetical protein
MGARLRWKKEWTHIICLFLLFRIVYSVLGIHAVAHGEPAPLAKDPIYATAATLLWPDAASRALINVWFRWDTGWYLQIAAFGYNAQDGTLAFMPLYPWLVRGFSYLAGGNYLLAALLVSNLASLAALLLLYEVAVQEGLAKDGLPIVASLALFPSAFFLFAAYTDSLFLALTLAAWLLARRENWLGAGGLAALAALCRLQGTLLTVVLLWAFLAARANAARLPALEQGRRIRQLVTTQSGQSNLTCLGRLAGWAIFLPALTFLAYTFWLQQTGLGDIATTLKAHWGIETVMPWTGAWLFLERLFCTQRVFIDWVDLSLFVLILGICLVGLFRLDPALSLYNWLNLALFLMRGSPPHLLDSFSRYLLSLFPAFLIIGGMKNHFARALLWIVWFGLQLFLAMAFLDWRWIA